MKLLHPPLIDFSTQIAFSIHHSLELLQHLTRPEEASVEQLCPPKLVGFCTSFSCNFLWVLEQLNKKLEWSYASMLERFESEENEMEAAKTCHTCLCARATHTFCALQNRESLMISIYTYRCSPEHCAKLQSQYWGCTGSCNWAESTVIGGHVHAASYAAFQKEISVSRVWKICRLSKLMFVIYWLF